MTGLAYNASLGLGDTVSTNEDFFIGNQWKGVEAGGLPTPVFNFLKRVVLFTVAGITSNNIKLQALALGNAAGGSDPDVIAGVVNSEFEALFERNRIVNLLREVLRNAAVDGDGCTYTYWDPDIDTGQPVKGAVVTEVIENTRIFFGNSADRRVQKQPYIIIASRELVEELRVRARLGRSTDADRITPDSGDFESDMSRLSGDRATVLLRLWKNRETKTVWAAETTKNAVIRKPWDTGLTLYPVTWLNWDSIHDSYHGQAMLTGLIPNQIFINKLFAMSMISLMTTAYPKIVYDKTRVQKWGQSCRRGHRRQRRRCQFGGQNHRPGADFAADRTVHRAGCQLYPNLPRRNGRRPGRGAAGEYQRHHRPAAGFRRSRRADPPESLRES